MSRWPPDARRRLQDAALDLYGRQGYAGTTVEAIAAAAGLSERTYFRHFADKGDVLFGDDARLLALLVEAIREAPARMAPLDALAAGLQRLAGDFELRRAATRRRHRLIAAQPELREREAAKLIAWNEPLAAVLVERGSDADAADNGAAIALGLFRVAYERWAGGRRATTLAAGLQGGFDALRKLAAAARRVRPGG